MAVRKGAFSFMVILVIAGCVKTTPQTQGHHLGTEFTTMFDRLFLSDEPLRYQDNVAFLSDIPLDVLSGVEEDLLSEKLKQFLSLEINDREFASDSTHTGVASEIAFLRLQAVQILGVVGSGEDVELIHSLKTNTIGEHPLFAEECMKAIGRIDESD